MIVNPEDRQVTDLVLVVQADDDQLEWCSRWERESPVPLLLAPAAPSVGVTDNLMFVKSRIEVEGVLPFPVVSIAEVDSKPALRQSGWVYTDICIFAYFQKHNRYISPGFSLKIFDGMCSPVFVLGEYAFDTHSLSKINL